MNMGPVQPGAASLGAYADAISDEADREEAKLLKSRKASRNEALIDNAERKIEQRKVAADEELKAAQDKADGGMFGGFIGIFLAVAAIVCACVIPGLSTAVVAAILALGAGALGAGSAVGGAVGAKNAEDNEEAAAEATEQADSAELMEKLLERQIDDDGELIRQVNQQMTQRWQDARQRENAENRVELRS